MIPLLTRDEANAVDADAVRIFGLPKGVLMENAGRGSAGVLLDRFREGSDHTVVVGGLGQNGGDAWVLARHLIVNGKRPLVFLVGDPQHIKGDAWTNFNALLALGVDVSMIAQDGLGKLEASLRDAGVVVDGLFGTGLGRPVEGLFREVVRVMNSFPAPKLALDLPSGVDANTGALLGEAIMAQVTATFGSHKRGLYQHPGAECAGEIALVSIGIPAPSRAEAWLFDGRDVVDLVPPRAPNAHKGKAGHVVVVGGSPGTSGAAVLAGLGALRAGAGRVTIWSRAQSLAAPPDLMIRELVADSKQSVDACLAFIAEHASSVVLGPGLGLDAPAHHVIDEVIRRAKVPVVVDADALTRLADDASSLKETPAARILTPHPGEASRLLSSPVRDVEADRYRSATRLAQNLGHVVALKGAGTICAAPGGELRVCRRGTPAMAVAGAGDVLAGVMAAFAVALPPLDAASVSVFLHAVAGELAATTDRGLLASDIAASLPDALAAVRQSAL